MATGNESRMDDLRQAAAAEMLIRQRARADVCRYARTIEIPGAPATDQDDEILKPVETTMAAHHLLILQAAQETAATRHGRLMIFAPPGSAKSTYASVVFPSWFLGTSPDARLILASYGDDLARKMGRRTRALLKQRRHAEILGTRLAADSQAANEFALSNGSEYMACGITAGITGNRAHGIVVDDPIKGREAADSDIQRNRIWEAWEDDIKTRLIPGGWVIWIQTRWHEDDAAGRILPPDWKGESGIIRCQDGNDWRVICLQARCETDSDPLGRAHGEYLWPEWFDHKHWSQFEKNARTWSALYQQQPTPGTGMIFEPDKITIIPSPPPGLRMCRGWDLAATADGGDWTVGALIGIDAMDRTYLLDIVRMQGAPHQVEAAILRCAELDGHEVEISLPQDPGQAGVMQVQYLTSQLSQYRVHSSVETGAKATRAGPLASQVGAGNVAMIRGSWNHSLIECMRVFPFGRYDDEVDACSRAFNRLATAPKWVWA